MILIGLDIKFIIRIKLACTHLLWFLAILATLYLQKVGGNLLETWYSHFTTSVLTSFVLKMELALLKIPSLKNTSKLDKENTARRSNIPNFVDYKAQEHLSKLKFINSSVVHPTTFLNKSSTQQLHCPIIWYNGSVILSCATDISFLKVVCSHCILIPQCLTGSSTLFGVKLKPIFFSL